jgi:WD40 repeat protein
VAWSKCGQFIGASDMSDDHSIAIFELKQNSTSMTLIAKGKGCKANIMSLGFTPNGDGLVATCVKSVAFFNWTNGLIKGTRGTGWGTTPADTILCQAYVGNILFTGNHAGEIISWVGIGISKRVKSHAQKINAMFANAQGQLITGSSDGLVNVWNVVGSAVTLHLTMNLKMPTLPSITAQATSVCEKDGSYLIGTRGGEIIEFDQ